MYVIPGSDKAKSKQFLRISSRRERDEMDKFINTILLNFVPFSHLVSHKDVLFKTFVVNKGL